MLASETIQSFLQFTGEVMTAWVIIPDSRSESRFPDHKQFVHLDTVCDMFIRESLRKYWTCRSKTLFYLHENYGDSYYSEQIKMTEWAREALLNRSCTQSCDNCQELSKGRGAKIECRMN
jgi:hypothetical protein